MVLRMVFEREDLQRVRLATGADPMWELLLSLCRLQSHTTPRCYQAWYEVAHQRISSARRGKQSLAMLCELVPENGDAPDFLTPATPVTDINAGCELLASTSIDRIHTDLVEAFGGRPAPSWLQSMVTSGRAGLRDIVGLARQGHDLLVAPQWMLVSSIVDADRIARSRTLADSGIGALLANLPGVLHWDGQVLQTRYPEHRTVYLRGRGLRLIPSYFCWGNPVTWIDPELPPALVYQAHHGDSPLRPTPSKALSQLLGDTRADFDCSVYPAHNQPIGRTGSHLPRHGEQTRHRPSRSQPHHQRPLRRSRAPPADPPRSGPPTRYSPR